MTTPIPAPPGIPLLGNVTDVDPQNSLASLCHLADIYGPIFKLTLTGKDRYFVASHELMDELCDEKRFQKGLSAPGWQLRNGTHDSLFTALPAEHNWEIAHRVLMPAFGPLSIRSMFDEMHDIASQLVLRWARYGPENRINTTDDFTRLTLDSIALCAMDTRFNSYYKDQLHPFVDAMTGFLSESGHRAGRPALQTYFMRAAQQQYDANIKYMHTVADQVVANRRLHPSGKHDLLEAMLNGRDPKTGEGLTDESISNNMITFLIAGHETTSGLLSFLFVFMLKNPATLQAAQKEVDTVIGDGPVTVDHMSRLPYITACLRETLRLQPTAPAFTVSPKNGTGSSTFIGGGKYEIPSGTSVSLLLPKVHRDPAVYGEDAEAFRPERMLEERFNKLPKNAWKPFGNGIRACIGRPFAWQEALLATALLLQNFNFRLDDPSYTLAIKQTLTIKPKDFYMRASLRQGKDVVHLERNLYSGPSLEEKKGSEIKGIGKPTVNGTSKKPMAIFYGSNTGTCEALAQSLATAAASRGYDARVATLDSATDSVPKDEPVIIVTASYEGEPPDNAAQFVQWLRNLRSDDLKGIQYAVFGCGHSDWQVTFQKIPKLIDGLFEELGAKRIASRGYADAAAGDMFNNFDDWEEKTLWPAISAAFGVTSEASVETSGLDVEITTQTRPSNLPQDVHTAIVLEARGLTGEKEPPKRHIQFKLPTNMAYKAGDYLAVLPLNMSKNVRRVIKRFGLPWDAMMTIKSSRSTQLPTDGLISVFDVLASYVELSQPATIKNVTAISNTVPPDSSEHIELKRLATDVFGAEISAKRVSPLDLLERFPTANLPFGEFLAMLPPLRIRQYSISSSPLADPTSCTLTWSVLDQESTAGDGKRFLGVASNYLSHLEKGEQAQVAVKPSHQAFHLPLATENTPLVMVCAGSGLAPFRGFVQERALQIEAGRKLAPALLFIGCRNSSADRIYAEDFEHWQSLGAVSLRYAFSRESDKSHGCKHVQDRLWKERDEVMDLFDQGAKVFVCGSGLVGKAVEEVAKKMYKEKAEKKGVERSKEEVEEWFKSNRNVRFASDVFA